MLGSCLRSALSPSSNHFLFVHFCTRLMYIIRYVSRWLPHVPSGTLLSAFIPRQDLDRVAAAKVDSHAKHATRNVWNFLELRPLCADSGLSMRQFSGGLSD